MKLKGTNKNPKRIGLMGGTFNPIHIGHLVTAEEAFFQFNLDEIIFVPSGKPPHKTDRDIASAEDRYLMAVIATASNPHFTVSRIEIDRVGPSYTVDTLREMKRIYGVDTELFFITGADAIIEILTWKDPEIIADLCQFIAATRPGYSLRKFEELHLVGNRKLPKVHFMEIPALAISSTDIRLRVKEGRPVKYLVPEGVDQYLKKRGLYKEHE